MGKWRRAWAVLGVVAVVASGCGLVTDDPAGRAAAGPTTTARPRLSTTTVSTVPATLPDGSPVVTTAPGGGTAGGGRPGSGTSGSAGGANGGAVPGAAGTGGSAGGSPGSGGSGSGSGNGTPAGPGLDRLPPADRTLVLTCLQMAAFQKAGGAAVVESIEQPTGAYDALVAMVDALDALVAVASTEVAGVARPIAAALRAGLAGDRSPSVLFGRMNTVIVDHELAISGMLNRLSRLCPAQVAADTVDQGSFFRLGTPLPPDLIGSLTPR